IMAELDEKKAPVVEEKKEKKPAKDKVPFGERMSHFFRGYKSELKKIVWSPWKQVRKNFFRVGFFRHSAARKAEQQHCRQYQC
ncbi:MAG: preprotein translocase subunit SecE, partial [Christensenellaceae bacterium]|nr:preprotein translocase subunit SecE [Christensenellaceae bacterium]